LRGIALAQGGVHAPGVQRVLTVLAVSVLLVVATMGYLWYTSTNDATAGGGWRLLAAVRAGNDVTFEHGGTAKMLGDNAAMQADWDALGVTEQLAPVRFDLETVIRATTFGSGSCPLHLDSVDFKANAVVIRASQGFVMACSGDAVPYSFVVAIQRERLPATPFTVIVQSDSFAAETQITPS
jgi:hypothetical protein